MAGVMQQQNNQDPTLETPQLSQEDIRGLLEHPTAETKIGVLNKISRHYNTNKFTEAQVQLAEQIFRLLLRQAEVEVRKALSDTLMNNRSAPVDVILSLAKDVEEVSLPILEFSEVLEDEHLVEIIRTTEQTAKHVAIAQRGKVSEAVSTELVNTNNEAVVDTLLQNDAAKISEPTYGKVINSYADKEKIVESLITRGSLSPTLISQMTQRVSKAIQKKIEKKYEQSFSDIGAFFQESSEVAAFKFIGQQAVDDDLMQLVDRLEERTELEESLHPVNGKLTQLLDGLEQLGHITPLSALAMGHLTLFEISISRLTGLPYTNVHKLVGDREGGLKALYDRAQLPMKLYDSVQFVVDVVRRMATEHEQQGTPYAKDDLHLMLRNIIKYSEGKQVRNLAHFVSVIRGHIEKSQGEW